MIPPHISDITKKSKKDIIHFLNALFEVYFIETT